MLMQNGRRSFGSVQVGEFFRYYSKLWLKVEDGAAYCFNYEEARFIDYRCGVFRCPKEKATQLIAIM